MKFNSLKDFYIHELRDLYSAETQLTKALPKMAKKASSEKLRTALEEHLEETKEQQSRVKDLLDDLGEKATGHKCEALEGLVKECEEVLSATGDEDTLDAGIIACGNRVEHYEIAGYGTARTHAKNLGLDEHVTVLEEILEQEKAADAKLTKLATSLNKQAAAR